MADDAQTILTPLQVDNSTKANAWEAFNSAKNENELGVRLQGMNLPQDAKAQLWEAKKRAVPPPTGPQYPPGTLQTAPGAPLMQYTGAGFPVLLGAKASGPSISYRGAQAPRNPDEQSTLGAIPWVAAAGAAPITGGTSLLGTAGMAALLGTGGSAVKQTIERGAGLRKDTSVKEALGTGALTGGTELVGGAVGKYVASPIIKQAAKLFGESPERIAELQALPKIEEGVRQRIVEAEASSRAGFKQAYDAMGIDAAPVNVANAKNIANNAAEELSKFTGVPRTMAKVASIPDPSESLLVDGQVRTTASAGDLPTTEKYSDPADILKRLSEWDQIPFRDAQRFRSNIEQYISKSRQLPTQVYNALKQVSGAISDGLEKTADTEGKLADFQAANAMFKQHAADFWNKTAPLRSFLSTAPDSTGTTLNRFMQTATQSRALDALDRRGVPTQDLRNLLAKGSDVLKGDIKQAATLRNLGRPALESQTVPPRREQVASTAIKAGLGALGVSGGLFGLYEGLKKH